MKILRFKGIWLLAGLKEGHCGWAGVGKVEGGMKGFEKSAGIEAYKL